MFLVWVLGFCAVVAGAVWLARLALRTSGELGRHEPRQGEPRNLVNNELQARQADPDLDPEREYPEFTDDTAPAVLSILPELEPPKWASSSRRKP